MKYRTLHGDPPQKNVPPAKIGEKGHSPWWDCCFLSKLPTPYLEFFPGGRVCGTSRVPPGRVVFVPVILVLIIWHCTPASTFCPKTPSTGRHYAWFGEYMGKIWRCCNLCWWLLRQVFVIHKLNTNVNTTPPGCSLPHLLGSMYRPSPFPTLSPPRWVAGNEACSRRGVLEEDYGTSPWGYFAICPLFYPDILFASLDRSLCMDIYVSLCPLLFPSLATLACVRCVCAACASP